MKNIFFIFFIGFLHGQELAVPGYECSDCHGTGGWDELELSNFNHSNTAFQLEGVHTIVNCSDCHKGSTLGEKHIFSNISTSCNSCHLDIHKNSLGDQCSQCHTSKSWIVEQRIFNHEETRFSLRGAHRFLDCAVCHDDLTSFDVTPSNCYSCHRDQYDLAENPSHILARINTDCLDCHEVRRSAWIPSTFDHNQQTLYPLTGAHFQAECAGCHQGIFFGTPSDCWSCHQEDFNATGTGQFPDAPDHVSDFYSSACDICHTTIEWKGAEVDHDLTEFPLTGSHQVIDCNQCHIDGSYDLSLDCAGCHSPSGLAETDHTTAELDHTTHNIAEFCELCHSTSSWEDKVFEHATFSNETCLQCHEPEYEISADPPHANDNISSDCKLCHSTDDWQDNSFTHSEQQTDFILHGLHIPVDCENCHVNNEYNGLSVNCESSGCHLSTYESTTDPNHTDYGYPIGYCDECHNDEGWEPIIFSHQLSLVCMTCHLPDYYGAENPVHDENIGFSTTCEDCHTLTNTWEGATFSHQGITTDCISCHLDDYNNTTDPNHVDLNISTDCENCHNSFTTWEGATFSHDGIIDGCSDCHMNDYNTTTNPDHALWGYPITCEECHISTTNWSDADFNHLFPIAPNGHQDDTAETCVSCHPDGNSDTFTCFASQCHTLSDMLDEHCEDGPNDCESCNGWVYPYNGVTSDDCYTCHPTGDEDDCEGDYRLFNKKDKDSWRNNFLPN